MSDCLASHLAAAPSKKTKYDYTDEQLYMEASPSVSGAA
jgi:hypothetical protein